LYLLLAYSIGVRWLLIKLKFFSFFSQFLISESLLCSGSTFSNKVAIFSIFFFLLNEKSLLILPLFELLQFFLNLIIFNMLDWIEVSFIHFKQRWKVWILAV
jgi:hypothetical protein